jgi:hypothetical protein
VVLELAVVFVGVYAAFAMSEFDDRREAAQRRQQLQAALVREIRDITSNTRRVATTLPKELAAFDSAVAAGRRPTLEPWIEPIRVDAHVWQATLAAGGLALFDVPTLYRISQFYNELNAGFEQLAQLRALSESILIPNLGRGSDEFYSSDGFNLRPKYAWYRQGLDRLAELAKSITALGDRLVEDLAKADPDGRVHLGGSLTER